MYFQFPHVPVKNRYQQTTELISKLAEHAKNAQALANSLKEYQSFMHNQSDANYSPDRMAELIFDKKNPIDDAAQNVFLELQDIQKRLQKLGFNVHNWVRSREEARKSGQ